MRRDPFRLAPILLGLLPLGACSSSSTPSYPEQELVLPSGSVDRLLDEFAAASYELDVDRMEALFVAVDDSPSGENRRLHLKELRKDWPRAKAEGQTMEVAFRGTSFDDLMGVIRTSMAVRTGGEEGVMDVEFAVLPTTDGLRILSMRIL